MFPENLIGTFCIVNGYAGSFTMKYVYDLIGTFCIVNIFLDVFYICKYNNLIGTFCIVNLIALITPCAMLFI